MVTDSFKTHPAQTLNTNGLSSHWKSCLPGPQERHHQIKTFCPLGGFHKPGIKKLRKHKKSPQTPNPSGFAEVERLSAHLLATFAKCRGISDWKKLYELDQASLLEGCFASQCLWEALAPLPPWMGTRQSWETPIACQRRGAPRAGFGPGLRVRRSIFRHLEQLLPAQLAHRWPARSLQNRFCHFTLKIYM